MGHHRRILAFSLVLSSIVVVVFAAGLSAALIPWAAGCPLTWGNFLCSPPANAEQRVDVAAIHMTVQWSASYTIRTQLGNGTWCGTVDSLTVTNAMDPARSWVIQARASADALRHEQSHFNLNEVYRRKLELSLHGLQSQGATGEEAQAHLNDLLHTTADAVLDRLADMQTRYDQETTHGTDSARQAYWDQQIAAWLLDPTSAP
jgi:hypothetical protein